MHMAQNSSSPSGNISDSMRTPPETNKSFSVLFLAGLTLRSLPKGPLNKVLAYLSHQIQQNHPAILQRLEPLQGSEFLICPTDLPHAMRMTFTGHQVNCRLEDEFMAPADVTISGPFLSLLDMMDGKVDGDALFFSRELTVEGDTEALLILRNAMDSDDIDLRNEILASFAWLHPPAQALFKMGGKLFKSLSHDMEMISQAITQPLSIRCETLEEENVSLHSKLSLLEKKLTKTQNRVQSLSRIQSEGRKSTS